MKILILVLILSFLGCVFPGDVAENHADLNYRTALLTTHTPGAQTIEFGTSNIYLYENSNIENYGFTYHGFKTGDITLTTENCDMVESPRTYRDKQYFGLDEFMLNPNPDKKCIIDFWASEGKIKKSKKYYSHNIREMGRVNVYVLRSNDERPLNFKFMQNGWEYDQTGQATIQLIEGKISIHRKFKVTVDTPSTDGEYAFRGCGKTSSFINFTGKNFSIPFHEVFDSTLLKKADSCQLQIVVLPHGNDPYYHYGRFDINIYDADVVKLEPPQITYTGSKIKACGNKKYVIAVKINDKICVDNCCKADYDPTEMTWVETRTRNGRKALLGILDREIIWRP